MVALTTKVLAASSCLVLAIGIYFYPRDDSFHHFYLSLQWPASFCNSTDLKACFKPVPGSFTIHGLWAQTISDEPYNCDDTKIKREICGKHPFKYEELEKDTELMEMMNKSWPNLIKGSSKDKQNKEFWKYEWEKHGCCLFNFKSKQKEYFKKTCGMWEQAPLLKIFEAHDIIPGDQTYINLERYIEAIRRSKVPGKRPGKFKCNINKKPNPTTQLLEVRLCTDKQVTKFMNCPGLEPSCSCGIAFPISYT